MTVEEAQGLLRNFNLKVTHQRLVILQALLSMKKHPTAEEIFEAVKVENPSISLGTVYRVLEIFIANGLAGKVLTDQNTQRFDANIKPHNHILCTNTNEIFDYEDDDLNKLIIEYLANKKIQNFKIDKIEVQLNGEKIDPEKKITID
jgi:Fur family peroxide stress response transcriptional regulator